jgi:hypothetical protein
MKAAQATQRETTRPQKCGISISIDNSFIRPPPLDKQTYSIMVTISSTGNTKPGSWQEAAHDVAAGFRVGIGHAIHHGAEFIADTFIKPIAHPFGITFEGEKPEPSDGIKVVGVGYGRTGTVCMEPDSGSTCGNSSLEIHR